MTGLGTELAPHQERLRELLKDRPGGPPRHADGDLAQSWLASLRHDPSTVISGLQRQLGDHRAGAAQSQMLAGLAMHYSEDHRMAEPEGPGAAFCDFCGAVDGLQETDELGSGDVPCHCHGMITRPCVNTDACVQRRQERYPPDLARVPSWISGAQARITDQDTARMLAAAVGQAAREFCLELTAAIEAEQVALAAEAEEIELSRPWWKDQPAWWGQAGAYDVHGVFHAAAPKFNNWSHTIAGGAHMGHTIAGNQLTPARLSALAKINGARAAQVAPGGAVSHQEPSGGQGGGTVPGGGQGAHAAVYGVPAGVHQGLEGGDIQMQQPQHPDGLANRSPAQAAAARPRRRPRRRGRKLAYTTRRKPVPKLAHRPPADSGWGPSGEGPSGSASSAEVT